MYRSTLYSKYASGTAYCLTCRNKPNNQSGSSSGETGRSTDTSWTSNFSKFWMLKFKIAAHLPSNENKHFQIWQTTQ